MKFEVVILAAGKGSRLGDMTHDIPKCLVEIAPSITLLDTQLTTLLRLFPNSNITIATGYKAGLIQKHIEKRYVGAPIKLIYVGGYEIYNNAHTLHQVLTEHSKDDTGILQINGDLVFEPSILEDARTLITEFSPKEAQIFVQERLCGQEEMKVLLREDSSIMSISKKTDPSLTIGEGFGMNYYGADFIQHLIPALDVAVQDSPNAYFEDGLNLLFKKTNKGKPYKVARGYAIEVDFPEDLEMARHNFSKSLG